MRATEFLKAFPTCERDVCTGGNCKAWLIPLTRTGAHVLLTSHIDGGYQPETSDTRVMLGFYDANGGYEETADGMQLVHTVTWARAARLIRDRLARCDIDSTG